MRFDVFTIFPQMFSGFLNESILKRAQQKGLIEIALHNIRDWTTDKHRTVDDTPYGGGPGMVMMAPPIVHAVEDVLGADLATTPVILLSPSGQVFAQEVARELVRYPRLALVCGRYEGIDDRVRILLRARELSIGDYVLTGGELAAAVVIDVVSRLVPGVIDPESLAEESHSSGLLEYPQYTRPPVFRGLGVPEILLSGNHAKIAEWRRMMALCRTKVRRPDLLARASLTPRDRQLLEQCPPDPFAHLGPVYDEHAVDERRAGDTD
ncbi:tRNA (guanosine(37)-N1)-methyltransferase TrmD [Thermomicrobium sp. 4228-Ro]|uniref:tRNA (guanosine(37)-N1)-methyltransferase TrmD n=1 Tax=Thermomicrobium sp. 4228-Ro TaxID=2993937 RepID=UPI0022494561|nr:tRNA (guanosine(37)-N1)-methyltransferase TrmD [Thermomicrobium sp. 4228-Ro]MCX2727347.1 tRNA (guanosine(37)-N1)-methyltransferase TrmD [Thermomicrobium sp. 4228-Ro]